MEKSKDVLEIKVLNWVKANAIIKGNWQKWTGHSYLQEAFVQQVGVVQSESSMSVCSCNGERQGQQVQGSLVVMGDTKG